MSEKPSFESFGVQAELIACLAERDIVRPTPVQVAVLQAENPDGDLIVQARTGSGKTLAFGLTFLSRLDAGQPLPQALVITPTRELAIQVCQSLRPLANALGLKTETLTGGGDMVAQLRGLRAGAQLLVGTPGRIADHLKRGSLKTEQLQTVVLDEGDQMLDLGFKDELEAILGALPAERRTLLFSATMPSEMRAIAKQYMRECQTITVEGTDVQHADISHVAYRIPKDGKFEALVNMLRLVASDRAMLFCRTKADTEEVCRRLSGEGFSVGYLHGDLEQRERNRVLTAFRHGRLQLLVATEVAARGIDVPGVAHVINVDLPFNLEAYVHRSGRTGRAGQKGLCLNLVTPMQNRFFRRMMHDGGITIDWQDVPTPEAIRKAETERLRKSIWAQLAETEASDEALAIAGEVLAFQDPVLVLAKLISGKLSDERVAGYDLTETTQRDWARERSRQDRPMPTARRGLAAGSRDAQDYARFRINLGHRDHLHPGKLVSLLCNVGGISGSQIGAIRIQHDETFFEVQETAAKGFHRAFASAKDAKRMGLEAVASNTPMPTSAQPRRGFHGINRSKQRHT